LAPIALAAALVPALRAQTMEDPDFVVEDLAGNYAQPTCFRFVSPTELLVGEKGGVVWDVRNGLKRATPVIDLQQEILNNGDRGLLSLAIDPNFATNGWLYLLYVVDPNGDGDDSEQESFGRLTRYTTALDASGNLVADPASRVVLIGATWSEGFPSLHLSHAPGDLRFASDGSLFISAGDGAHFDLTDPGGYDPNGFGAGKFDASEDIGAFRAQSLTSLAGKILRVDPATGLGLASNPFFTGSATDHQSRIWAMGLRNPFRISLIPGTGPVDQLYVCNVGWETWESLYHCNGGENFGWPCREGPVDCSSYSTIDPHGECDDPSIFTAPLFTYHHYMYNEQYNPDFVGQCCVGMMVYNGTEYPASYTGRLFVADYASEWIRSVLLIDGAVAQSDRFARDVGHPVDLEPDPRNGDILYASMSAGVIRRIRYTKANQPPVALATVAPTSGPSPLAVSFDATASYDPELAPLTYDWDFGDGSAHSKSAVASHTYVSSGAYFPVLVVTDPAGNTASTVRTIAVDNSPPSVTIDDPANGSFFVVGQPVAFDATAADKEDDAAGLPLTVQWIVDLVHDHHVHPAWATLNGAHVTYVPPVHGESVYLHVTLVATDSGGLTTSKDFVLYDQNAKPVPHLVSVSSLTPRFGHPIVATGHVHWAGHGDADLLFDWGDGSTDRFRASHFVDCTPKHFYAAPGAYELRFSTSDGTDTESVGEPILVRPLYPEVAFFAPLVASHWIPVDQQYTIANDFVTLLGRAGLGGRMFSSGDETALETWMTDYLQDLPRDWLVCLDVGASAAYDGQNNDSLAEKWLNAGNGIVWTGFNPFADYLLPDGTESNQGAGSFALDELLDAAKPHLVDGHGKMKLAADAGEIPSLQPFDSSTALMTSRLNSDWTVAKLYASTGKTPVVSDALLIKNSKGGEYAQFYCVNDSKLPRKAVLRDFLISHVYANLPKGPPSFALVSPAPMERILATQPTFVWDATPEAMSWLVEVATDATFANPVFTATVMRSTKTVGTTASVQCTTPLQSGKSYSWRVSSRDAFGSITTPTRAFHVQ
jgi:glucose/arabinose dehydrogenase/PKD repeat protein